MVKRFLLVITWFALTPIALIFLFILINQHNQIVYLSRIGPQTAAVLPDNKVEGLVLGEKIDDTRPLLVSNFLKGTKLEPYSAYMVETADKYGLDYRLIPAIAMKEGGGGNAVKEESHNSWGFENGRTYFDSWETAIDTVGKTLKNRYADKGLVTPEQIMAVYAPPQLLTGGKWAKDVNFFFSKMTSL